LTKPHLHTRFFTRDGVVRAIEGLSLTVQAGEVLGIVGESGCGKSVTALSVMRLIPPQSGRIVQGSVRFEGKPEWSFQHLRPGKSQTAEFPFQVAEGIEKCVLKTYCTNPNANKAVLGLFRRKNLSIPKINGIPSGGKDLAVFLAEKGAHCQLIREGSPVADVWIALQASALAVLVSARDASITRGCPVWKESCFELFAKTECSEISQVFLCPSTSDNAAAAFELDRSASAIVPSQVIDIQEVGRKEKEYKLVAQVPLSILSLPPDARDFRMEMVFTSVTSPEHGHQRTPLFHTVEDPSTNSRGFGFIKI
jgi:ABC-type dipeptide/oligopeptide/nickel transport system ATPase component